LLASSCKAWVVGEYSIPQFMKAEEDVPQRPMVREEFDLAWTVKQNVVICKRKQHVRNVWPWSCPCNNSCSPPSSFKPSSSHSKLCSSSSSANNTPPFGPKLSCSIISSIVTKSRTSTAGWYDVWSFAGSRLTTEHLRSMAVMNCCMPSQYVDFPEPGGPMTNCANGILVLRWKVKLNATS